jgi:hypothetical protein
MQVHVLLNVCAKCVCVYLYVQKKLMESLMEANKWRSAFKEVAALAGYPSSTTRDPDVQGVLDSVQRIKSQGQKLQVSCLCVGGYGCGCGCARTSIFETTIWTRQKFKSRAEYSLAVVSCGSLGVHVYIKVTSHSLLRARAHTHTHTHTHAHAQEEARDLHRHQASLQVSVAAKLG